MRWLKLRNVFITNPTKNSLLNMASFLKLAKLGLTDMRQTDTLNPSTKHAYLQLFRTIKLQAMQSLSGSVTNMFMNYMSLLA